MYLVDANSGVTSCTKSILHSREKDGLCTRRDARISVDEVRWCGIRRGWWDRCRRDLGRGARWVEEERTVEEDLQGVAKSGRGDAGGSRGGEVGFV